MAIPGEKYILYHYNPSLPAAIVFIVLFFSTTFLHTFQLAKKRTWYFIPFVIGGFFESIGYIGRAISSTQSPDWTTGPYICQSLLLLLAPALFAASLYMSLGRIIRLTDGESYALIRPKWLTKLFVAGDVLSFLSQSTGGALLARAKDQSGIQLGERVIVAGLFIQVVFFGCFIFVAGLFQYRISFSTHLVSLQVPWRRHLWILYIASALIMIRSIVRIAEYIQGSTGVLLGHELYLYIFDASMMFSTMVIFNIWHPSEISKHGGLDLTVQEVNREEAGYSMTAKSSRATMKS